MSLVSRVLEGGAGESGEADRADMTCKAGVKGGINGVNKAPADIKSRCISHEGSEGTRVIVAFYAPPACLPAGEGTDALPSNSPSPPFPAPPRHPFPAGGGRECNEVPPINQETGRGNRAPFSSLRSDVSFIENGCDALGRLHNNLSP